MLLIVVAEIDTVPAAQHPENVQTQMQPKQPDRPPAVRIIYISWSVFMVNGNVKLNG